MDLVADRAGSMILSEETFPVRTRDTLVECCHAMMQAARLQLAFRSGGCFLDEDTPKASSNLSDKFSSMSPLFLSPSKSYSDAITATADFTNSLSFSMDEADRMHSAPFAPPAPRRATTPATVATITSSRSHLHLSHLAPIKTQYKTSPPSATSVSLNLNPSIQPSSPFSSILSSHLPLPAEDAQLPLVFSLTDPVHMKCSTSMTDAQVKIALMESLALDESSDSDRPSSSVCEEEKVGLPPHAEPAAALPSGSEQSDLYPVSDRKRAKSGYDSETMSYSGLAVDPAEAEEEEEEEEEDIEEEYAHQAKKKKTSKICKKQGLTLHKSSSRLICTSCKTTSTPQWREGPQGARTLCNACGLRFRKGLSLPY
eukprot:gene28984-32172_t